MNPHASGKQLPRRVSSSCDALKHAVSTLNRLDDFNSFKIGSGFFSDIFKVTHRTTGQIMVLKMNTKHCNRPNALQEVQLMNRLNHPNILKFMGVCVHEGQLHALTEFINNGNLEQLLADTRIELPWSIRIELARDIALGMRYLHHRSVFHRDLTSKNILIRKQGREITAIVGDFGLATKIPEPLSNVRLPVVGSPYWMAPECLRGEIYDQTADVFSYGIILCEILARIEADPDILPRTKSFGLDYVAYSHMVEDCPLDFLHLAFRCCQVDPKKRPTFLEIVELLTEIVENIKEHTEVYTMSKAANRHMLSHKSALLNKRSISDEMSPPPESSPPQNLLAPCTTGIRRLSGSIHLEATALMIGKVMSKEDPFYSPHKTNPFATSIRYRSGQKILGKPMELYFDLPSPSKAYTPPCTPITPGDDETGTTPLILWRPRCRSLPGSPTQLRRMIRHDYTSPDIAGIVNQMNANSNNKRNKFAKNRSVSSTTAPNLKSNFHSDDSSSNDSAVDCGHDELVVPSYRRSNSSSSSRGNTLHEADDLEDDRWYTRNRLSHCDDSYVSADDVLPLSPASSISSHGELEELRSSLNHVLESRDLRHVKVSKAQD